MGDIAKEILPVTIEDELKKSYLDYAMSVIVGRALTVIASVSPLAMAASNCLSSGTSSSAISFLSSFYVLIVFTLPSYLTCW